MLFRILPQIKVQTYDVSGHAWRPAPLEPLYRWAVVDPDMSVDEITEQEALALIDRLHRRPSSPG